MTWVDKGKPPLALDEQKKAKDRLVVLSPMGHSWKFQGFDGQVEEAHGELLASAFSGVSHELHVAYYPPRTPRMCISFS
jgi:hypothetical protein